VHAGRLEGYFQLFRRVVLPLAHRRATVDALLAPKDRAARERFYDEVWDTRRWRLLVRLFFGRQAMGHLGRDPACFRHVHQPVGPAILARARHALTAQPTHDNPYLRYILTGSVGPLLPDYLLPAHHEPIRDALSRLSLHEGSLERLLPGLPASTVDAFNLSDVGEYVSAAAFQALLREVRRTASRGARVTWWDLLALREHPPDLDSTLELRAGASAALHERAQAFFYSRFVLEVARERGPSTRAGRPGRDGGGGGGGPRSRRDRETPPRVGGRAHPQARARGQRAHRRGVPVALLERPERRGGHWRLRRLHGGHRSAGPRRAGSSRQCRSWPSRSSSA